ncbi:sensor histidine kinase [Paenibacillus typhae]|uniref:sensor histidine kinase n=1 Tax=Paenibacillus typhae TaxID=1174501 RepID=UPI001C8D9C51|nr:HAMP domain-containing sensor histidine kinase [Paenibacillus typhae]MBY0012330.1 HAMP domain-containing histidine kinase [Paenibacillus typhae]
MHLAIAILLALAAVSLLIAYLLQRHSIIQVRRQLADADASSVQHLHLKLPLPGCEMERLVVAVNGQLEQRRKEQILHRSRERAVKEEIANLSHDLRTPLTSMQGYAHLLNDPAAPAAERQEYLEIILLKLAVMNNIVESFYELSSMDSGDYPLDRRPLYLYSLLTEVILAFHTDLIRKNIEVQLNLEESVRMIPLDEKAMIRIFSNVLQNVLRYGKSRLAISLFTEADKVKIVFANDTDHIRREDLPRLFERTYTSDPSRSSGQLGLGLAIVKQLVEKQGGGIGTALDGGEFQLVLTFGEY